MIQRVYGAAEPGHITSKHESKHETKLSQQASCTMSERREKRAWHQQAKQGKEPSQPSSAPLVSFQLTEHHELRKVRTQQTDKLFLSFFPIFPEIRHAYRASHGETIYHKVLPVPPFSANQGKKKNTMFSFFQVQICQQTYDKRASS